MDCSVQFLADPAPQVRTLVLKPDFPRTIGNAETSDFNDWTVPPGRRFRALKLWFLLRAHGLECLRGHKRNRIKWTLGLADIIGDMDGFEITSKPVPSLFTFCYPDDDATEDLLERINDDRRVCLTQARHRGRLVIQVAVGQFDCTRDDLMTVAEILRALTAE